MNPNPASPDSVGGFALLVVALALAGAVVLGVIFYGMFAPTGWVMRRAGRDALRRSFDPGMKTYWIERQPPGPPAEDLRNQF